MSNGKRIADALRPAGIRQRKGAGCAHAIGAVHAGEEVEMAVGGAIAPRPRPVVLTAQSDRHAPLCPIDPKLQVSGILFSRICKVIAQQMVLLPFAGPLLKKPQRVVDLRAAALHSSRQAG